MSSTFIILVNNICPCVRLRYTHLLNWPHAAWRWQHGADWSRSCRSHCVRSSASEGRCQQGGQRGGVYNYKDGLLVLFHATFWILVWNSKVTLHGTTYETQHGYTALMWAAMKGHAECVNVLLLGGADKEAKDDVRDMWFVLFTFAHACMYACMHVCEIVSCSSSSDKFILNLVMFHILLIFLHLTLFCFVSQSKWTALDHARHFGRHQIVELLTQGPNRA